MGYNKEDSVNRYYDLDKILDLDLDMEIKSNIKEKFGKVVYFESNDDCRIGELRGLEKNPKLSMTYYIIVSNSGEEILVPVYKSISTL